MWCEKTYVMLGEEKYIENVEKENICLGGMSQRGYMRDDLGEVHGSQIL